MAGTFSNPSIMNGPSTPGGVAVASQGGSSMAGTFSNLSLAEGIAVNSKSGFGTYKTNGKYCSVRLTNVPY